MEDTQHLQFVMQQACKRTLLAHSVLLEATKHLRG